MATHASDRLGSSGPLLVVERLELLSLPFWLWQAWRHGGGYFVGWSRALHGKRLRDWICRMAGLRQLRYEEFPGSYYEVHRVACQGANDAMYDEAARDRAAPAIAFLRHFHDHALLDAALRRTMQDLYTVGRVKTLVFLRTLARLHAPIIFIPRDTVSPRSWVPTQLGAIWETVHIPPPMYVVNAVKARIETLGVAMVACLMVAALLLKRGLVLSAPPPTPWRVGFQISEEALDWRPYHRTFLYDEAALAPSKILHVVQKGNEEMHRYFQSHGYHLVDVERLPVPLGYLLRRVIPRFLGGAVWLSLKHAWGGEGGAFVWGALNVSYQLIKAEILDMTYRTDVFIGRDVTIFSHLIRTLLHGLRGGITIGYSQGDETYYDTASSYLGSHVFCFWGEFQQALLKHNARYCGSTHVIGAGIYGLDETYAWVKNGIVPEPYKTLRQRHRIIGAFTTSFGEDFIMDRDMAIAWCRAVIALANRYADTMVVLKPKGRELDDPVFQHLVAAGGSRVVVDRAMWTYDFLPALDVMICIGASSIGLEGLMAGKRVIYFDPTGLADHPYASYASCLVARTADELFAIADRILVEDQYVEPGVLAYIRRHHGLAFDGKVTARFRDVVCAALEQTSAPASGEAGKVSGTRFSPTGRA